MDSPDTPIEPAQRSNTHNLQCPAYWNKLRNTLHKVWAANIRPEMPVGTAPGFFKSTRTILFSSWLNILLLCVPVSCTLHFVWSRDRMNTHDVIIFVFSSLSIIPLAKLLIFATDELSSRVGRALGGLASISLGNVFELIISISALTRCEIHVVQSSLLGSVLTKLLLVLGTQLLIGGMRSAGSDSSTGLRIPSPLLVLSVATLLLPQAFHFVAGDQIEDAQGRPWILNASHVAAIIFLCAYFCYLVFVLHKHAWQYNEKQASENNARSTPFPQSSVKERMDDIKKDDGNVVSPILLSSNGQPATESARTSGDASSSIRRQSVDPTATHSMESDLEKGAPEYSSVSEKTPQMSLFSAIFSLVIVAIIFGFTSESLVSSIDGLTDTGHINKEFVSFVLLPIARNLAEIINAAGESEEVKRNSSLNSALNSSVQIVLFVIPFVVILGWILDKPLTLLFDPFECIALFFAVIMVIITVESREPSWLEGGLLICFSAVLVVMLWYYPGTNIATQLDSSGCPSGS